MKLTSILALIIVFGTVVVKAAGPNSMFYPGEELTYRVSYLNITLGTVRTVVEPFTQLDGKKVAKVKIYIDSHPNIPFVSLHSVYESWIDTTGAFSYKFNANTRIDDNTWDFDQYLFDYAGKKATIEKWRNKEKVNSSSFELLKKYNDGSSLLFAARALLYAGKSYKVPTVIMEKAVSTVINFAGNRAKTEIDACDYPIKTVYLNGDANWTGVYGLTGRFEGWFADDDSRIPIQAKMNVYVGSVTIELQKWKRGSWAPPKASS
ncbi:MAG: DUF3108 domain-containing protein [Bradyrhizobiaceae bacterium]|nr:DUF3108 domain-containing protein [Bradyrhizobiaceae bacterium]